LEEACQRKFSFEKFFSNASQRLAFAANYAIACYPGDANFFAKCACDYRCAPIFSYLAQFSGHRDRRLPASPRAGWQENSPASHRGRFDRGKRSEPIEAQSAVRDFEIFEPRSVAVAARRRRKAQGRDQWIT
jgi:hypothetical protein